MKMRLILPQARHFWHRAANARRNAQHVLISCSAGADASEIGMPLEATAFAQRISSSLPMCFRACILLHIFWHLAVYHQRSDYYPVDRDGKKYNAADGEVVMIFGATNWGGIDRETNQVDVLGANGRGFFNAEDLTVIY